MTSHPDWRTAPDPLLCIGCQATEAACDNRRMFSGRPCCEACEHEPKERTLLRDL